MKDRFVSLTFTCLVVLGCGLPKVDYEIGSGRVIGRETCNTNSTLNALLISLDTNSVRGPFGKDASFNGKKFKNVVKTYSLEASRLDSNKRYTFFFYQKDIIPNPVCDLPITNSINVPQIKIEEVANTVQ